MSIDSLTQDALSIWQSGVDAVKPENLIPRVVSLSNRELQIRDKVFPLNDWDRIVVVGGGKAGAGMAKSLERVLGEALCREKVTGWINVPENCVEQLTSIHLHGARPAGVNEPTEAGVQGTREILKLASSCGPRDLCLVLISGGGSALMPAPAKGITLDQKHEITRRLMHSGATIQELNCVRKQLSAVKGGNLALAAAGAGQIVALIISDVVGDPLDVIGSGPTVVDSSTPHQALELLVKFYGEESKISAEVLQLLKSRIQDLESRQFPQRLQNIVIGNNDVALTASAQEAIRQGYAVYSLGSDNEGDADDEGRSIARLGMRILGSQEPVKPPACVLSGGEPTVTFAPSSEPRKGGRNQQLALSSLIELGETALENIVILSGGTDGEDGPTDAAGAFVDAENLQKARQLGLHLEEFRDVQNAYPFFEATGGLLKTGPTNTNVMDLRIMLVGGDRN